MQKHTITAHTDFYFILVTGIDNRSRAYLYRRTNTGDKWITNALTDGRSTEHLHDQFTKFITDNYVSDKSDGRNTCHHTCAASSL